MASNYVVPSLTIAAERVGCAPTTVMHRKAGRRSREEEQQARQKLTAEEERQWKEIALSVVQKQNPNETLGQTWEHNFKKRQPEVKSRFSNQLDFVGNTQGNDIELMRKFFHQYVSIVQDFSLKPQNTYNIDEIGFLLGMGQSERVLEVVRHPREKGTLQFCAQNESMAKRFLERNFGDGSPSAQKAQETNDYRLLIFDGHSSHVNFSFLEYCIEHKIIPFCLPPHTTHRIQPLDVAIFGPYKHYYQRELTKQFENHDYGIGKDNFYEIPMAARRQAFTPKNIISGFWNTELIPADGSIVLQKLPSMSESLDSLSIASPHLSLLENHNQPVESHPPVESLTETTESMKSRTKSPNRDPNNHGQVKSLKTLSADEIHHLCVPKNLGQIEEQELIVYSTLPSNNPVAWGLKKIIGNFAIMARCAMMELELKDQRITNLESQLAISKTKKVRNRTRIPTHGKAWVDGEDIRKFFAEQMQSQQRMAEQRCRNLETLITE
ncbi:DDE-domain-containing protein [Choiromyces venosus 120613-1]|uniref:DDE-domain-containing protein n=1 Tax=Choiromyces venosus 120613-1 TaxID=1336337 RepID=A0A3N4IT57_9PEZI|nr:DDE-domain-containing protein [Choiromyces venosus 120613-1]